MISVLHDRSHCVGFLRSAGPRGFQAYDAAGQLLGLFQDKQAAFPIMVEQHVGALVVASDPFFWSRRGKVVSLAARYGLPAIYYLPEFSRAGGLMAYGNSLPDIYRLVGVYVGRILKGEKPADLPVVQSTKFQFVINLPTARALGIEVPNAMRLLADEVVE
jgi:putative tryptophan/tyrosine transport system substrate-binding protein